MIRTVVIVNDGWKWTTGTLNVPYLASPLNRARETVISC